MLGVLLGIVVLVVILLVAVLPLKIAASLLGADETGFGRCLLTLIVSAAISLVLSILFVLSGVFGDPGTSLGGILLAFLVQFLVYSGVISVMLGGGFPRGMGIALLSNVFAGVLAGGVALVAVLAVGAAGFSLGNLDLSSLGSEGFDPNMLSEHLRQAPPADKRGAENPTALAQCLSERGAVMFATDWCGYCQRQREDFGAAFRHVVEVDCDRQTDLCRREGITGYPTWKIGNGLYPGYQKLSTLASAAGCMNATTAPAGGGSLLGALLGNGGEEKPEEVVEEEPVSIDQIPEAPDKKLYTWRDAQGRLHVTHTPPPHGAQVSN